MLNSKYWDMKYNGASEEELLELYKDISNLNILSCIEIDRAKKISPVGAKKELDKIRNKHNLGKGIISRNKEKKEVGIRPKFFKYLDGGKDYKFEWFNTGMDFLQKVLDEDIIKLGNTKTLFLKDLLIDIKIKNSERLVCDRLGKLFIELKQKQNAIWNNNNIVDKKQLCDELYNEVLNKLNKNNITDGVVSTILNRISNSYTKENMKDWKSIGVKILKLLYEYDYNLLYNVLKFNNENFDILIENNDGDIKIYNKKYSKIIKK